MFLRLSQIYEFAKANFNSRNMNEGEEVLKSGQVITVGCKKTENSDSTKHISGLVLQTSALKLFPHTVEGIINIIIESPIIQEMTCSCKAGLFGNCKHIVAVLLFLERYKY